MHGLRACAGELLPRIHHAPQEPPRASTCPRLEGALSPSLLEIAATVQFHSSAPSPSLTLILTLTRPPCRCTGQPVTFVEADLEVALAIDLPDELRTIRKNHAVGSASRAKALRDAGCSSSRSRARRC